MNSDARNTGVRVNMWQTPRALYRLLTLTKDLGPVLRKFHAYHAREIDTVFQRLGHGGTFRGVTWPGWSPSSLPHNRGGSGAAVGRTRPSGQRVTLSSQLLQDTGRLRQDAATGVFVLTRDKLSYGPSVLYAEKQYAVRTPYSVTPADRDMLLELTLKAITQALESR